MTTTTARKGHTKPRKRIALSLGIMAARCVNKLYECAAIALKGNDARPNSPSAWHSTSNGACSLRTRSRSRDKRCVTTSERRARFKPPAANQSSLRSGANFKPQREQRQTGRLPALFQQGSCSECVVAKSFLFRVERSTTQEFQIAY